MISGQKNPKNSVKYVFLKDVLKNHVFDLKSLKNDRFGSNKLLNIISLFIILMQKMLMLQKLK